ncbi:ATP-binding protein [Agathobaculum sp. TL06]
MIKRERYMEQLRPFFDKPVVKVMTGIRRCGKSVMLELIRDELVAQGRPEEHMLLLNFESKLLPFSKTADDAFAYLAAYVQQTPGRKYLFLDEVQELPAWETMVNALMIDCDVDLYITGSNAKLLSGELATYLGGRYVEIKVYPFSFLEVRDILAAQGKPIGESEAFLHYLTYGGMPFIYAYQIEPQAALQYLTDIFDSILLKDVAQRNKIRDIGLFQKVLTYFIAGIGTTWSATSIQKYLKSEHRTISPETLYNYIEYCKEAGILHLVSREDIIGKKLLQFQEKIYLTDHGLREAVYGNNQRDVQQVLENIVYMELLRRGYTVTVGKNEGWEVDFAAQKGADKLYVQVAYLLADEQTVEREFRALEAIPDNYPKYVVTMDEIDRSRNGIKHRNIRRFLQMDAFL